MTFKYFLIALLVSLPLGNLYAEVIQVPLGQQASELKTLKRPTLGMTKNQVETEFGKPASWSDPKGEPPISKWEYGQFVVYFESEYVIHAVLKHTPKPEETVNTQ